MNFKSLCRGAAAAGVVALLSACGGGAVDDYNPVSIYAFGDEQSLLTNESTRPNNGFKYSVNLADTTDTTDLECLTYPIWTQLVASGFGRVFDQCRSSTATATAFMRATPLAKVADLDGQIAGTVTGTNTSKNAITFVDKDLATMMVGTYDMLELYGRVVGKTAALAAALGSNYDTVVTGSALTYDQAVAEATRRGEQWAAVQNRVANAGARVLVMTIPDLSFSPMAIADQTAGNTDSFTEKRRRQLLKDMTTAYNLAMRKNQINDGRLIGMVLGDTELDSMVRFPGSYSLSNVVDAVCTTALPNCTAATVISAATDKATQWLWADSYRLGIEYQRRMGDLAYYRANNNPF